MRRYPAICVVAFSFLVSGCNCGDNSCLTHDDCSCSRPFCNDEGKCVRCLISEHCLDGYECRDNKCVESADQDGCTCHRQCGEPGLEYCDHNRGVCVECVLHSHCAEDEALCNNGICRRCIDYSCREITLSCEINGFSPLREYTGFYLYIEGKRYLEYTGLVPGNNYADAVMIVMDERKMPVPDFETGSINLGIHAGGSNPGECSVCVFVMEDCRYHGTGHVSGCERMYMAVEGNLVIEEIGRVCGGRFDGFIENVVLEPVSDDNNYSSSELSGWCISHMPFASRINRECFKDTDCPEDRPFCSDSGFCVECLVHEDCESNDFCIDGKCTDLSDCAFSGFIPVQEEVFMDSSYYYYMEYNAVDAEGNSLKILPQRSSSHPEPGTYPLSVTGAKALLHSQCGDTEECDTFVSLTGDLVIDNIGFEEGDIFSGRLEGLYLKEAAADSFGQYRPLPGGRLWCIQEMPFSASP